MAGPTTEDRIYLGEIATKGTIAAAITARLIQHAEANGVPLAGLLDRVGWACLQAPGPDARVSFRVHWGVWRYVHEHQVPGDFGLTFGDSFELDHLGVLGMLMTHSATLEQAVAQQARFQRLLLDVPLKVTRLEPDKLVIEHPPLPVALELPHMIVAGLGFWMKLLRTLIGERVTALRVELPHAPLTSPERYRATFGICPRFDSQRILLELGWAYARSRTRRLARPPSCSGATPRCG